MSASSPSRALARPLITAAAIASVTAPHTAHAQSYLLARGVSLAAGAASFDLRGSGTTATVALRGDAELTPWLVGELGVGALRPNEAIGPRPIYVVPEAQLQLQLRAGALRPYVGAGGGWFYAIGAGRKGQSARAASAAGGARLDFTDARFGVRAEFRVRGMDREFARRTAEWTGAVVWRF